MKQKQAELSIAVCTYNRVKMLEKCLQSLFVQSLPKNKCEILVIDNNSSDTTVALVKRLQKKSKYPLRYFFEKRQGISHARNSAIKNAKGKYLAYLDDDEIAPAHWAKIILNCFERVRPIPDAIGGPTFPRYPEGKTNYFPDERATTAYFGKSSDLLVNLSSKAEWGFGVGNSAFRLSSLKKHKGFDTRLGRKGKRIFTGEETELYTRMYAKGAVFWYEASMVAYHSIPYKRTTLSYQFRQGIDEGMSYALMDGLKRSFRYFFKAALAILSMPARMLGIVIRHPFKFRSILVQKLRKEGGHIGYFCKQLRMLFSFQFTFFLAIKVFLCAVKAD